MSERAERCETCRFWEREEDTADDIFEEPTLGQIVVGECHRYPPVRQASEKMWAMFPLLPEGNWCGEWQPAEPALRLEADPQ